MNAHDVLREYRAGGDVPQLTLFPSGVWVSTGVVFCGEGRARSGERDSRQVQCLSGSPDPEAPE